MGRLKRKISASTLMETLVATSIILIVFVVASLILMRTFKSVADRDTFSIENRLDKLQYLFKHEKVVLPHNETFGAYEVSIETTKEEELEYIIYTAKKIEQEKPLVRKQIK